MHGRRAVASGVIATMGLTALLLTGCGEATPSADGEDSVQEVAVTGEAGAATFTDGVYTSPLTRMEIRASRVIRPGEEGNEYGESAVLAVWYDTTNISGQMTDPLTAWLTHFRVSQDAGNGLHTELTLAMAPDARLMATQTQSIEAGATAGGAVAYRLHDESATVRITALDTALNEIGSQDLPLQ